MLFALENKRVKKDPPLNTSTWSFEEWGKVHYITILGIVLSISKQKA
jgi:hypothetical protein